MALIGHLILLGEDVREEYGLRDIYFSEDVGDPYSWRPGSTVTMYLGSMPEGLSELVEGRIPSRLARLRVRAEEAIGIHLNDLYDVFHRAYMNNIVPLLSRRAHTTTMKRIEYYVAVAEKGEVVEVEGDVDRVTIPFFKAWATGHTHPAGHCMFSSKDLESARDLFMTGGLETGVVTEGCIVLLWRRGLFTEEDLDALLDLQHDIRRLRRREDLTRAIQKFQRSARSLSISALLAGLPPR